MRVVAAMSGGVDSSVAAMLLKKTGHEVLGVHLRMRGDSSLSTSAESTSSTPTSNCVNPQHETDARIVAEAAGIPFQALDMRQAFEIEIARPFMEAYQRAETPNPCVSCNVKVKLGPLLKWAIENGYEKIATGHYARIAYDEALDRWQLRRGLMPTKDQSYYLCGLRQEQLAHLLLPLGDKEKSETRKLAAEWGLTVAEKADSQDICLTSGTDYREYLAQRLGEEGLGGEGPIVNTRGEVLGKHGGLAGYTVGQRKGLGLTSPRPLYVVALKADTNTLIVGDEEDLYQRSLIATNFNWVSWPPREQGEEFRGEVQIRYQHKAAPATVKVLKADEVATEVEITFDQPQRAVAPGQIAVAYQGELLIGGGRIRRTG